MLEARDLTFAYDDRRPILREWSAAFHGGEVVAVTGPSGRGKSSLLYLLGLMLRPDSGEVLVEGHSMADQPDRARAHLRARRFGFVFQDAALDASRTVIDNVVETALYRGADRRVSIGRARGLLEQFGVDVREDARPGEVSGGQAQRIALCRALLGDPGILLADEPTGNLDPASAAVVVEAFHARAHAGAAVVIVTHDPALVARCHRSIQL
jgi:putative ABC transport system ATP-binding protein